MTDPANVRFLQNNLAAAAGATVTTSSAVSGFAGSEAVEPLRHRKWLTAGGFQVISSNKKIYINDGTNKTITLTEANYNTGTLLAAHIQTQLNASSTLWTCTYSLTTYKFTIGRSSGTRTLRFTVTTDAAWDMLGYLYVVDTVTGTGLVADEVRIHTKEYIHVDLGSAQSITGMIMQGAADSLFDIPTTAVLRIKGDNVNDFSAAATPAVDELVTVTTRGVAFFTAALTYRYWQISWVDRTNPNGPGYSIHQFYLGDHVEPAAHNFNIGFVRRIVDPSIVSRSSRGVKYWNRGVKYWRYESVNIANLSDADRVTLEAMLLDLGTSQPFFIALDPDAAISNDACELTKYVSFDGDLSIQQFRHKYYQFDLSMEEVV